MLSMLRLLLLIHRVRLFTAEVESETNVAVVAVTGAVTGAVAAVTGAVAAFATYKLVAHSLYVLKHKI